MLVFCHEFLERPLELPALRRRTSATSASTSSPSTSATTAQSDAEPGYQPLQWVTDHEVRDLQAALAYLRTRPDRDPAGVGLFGVSRGGGDGPLRRRRATRGVWGVITDGAFPTRGTMLAYILRWAEIYVGASPSSGGSCPIWVFEFLGWSAGCGRSGG